MRVAASHLQAGDYLPCTKTHVVQIARAGLNIPTGKVVVWTTRNGQLKRSTWGARTQITVERGN